MKSFLVSFVFSAALFFAHSALAQGQAPAFQCTELLEDPSMGQDDVEMSLTHSQISVGGYDGQNLAPFEPSKPQRYYVGLTKTGFSTLVVETSLLLTQPGKVIATHLNSAGQPEQRMEYRCQMLTEKH